ncbi:MAG: ABC transporter substrate-binding protein [Cryomorphaceae bacterium]|nr:ABC transporter substrate-binding protein [Flavobacteriales bacterium]
MKLAPFLVIPIVLWSCSQRSDHSDLSVFRYNESAGISSLDPAYSRNLENIWACNMLYNGLTEVNDNLEVEPSIARSWTIDSSGTEYTFHLRSDVFFHDSEAFKDSVGRRVTARDFVYSFKRILSPSLSSPGSWVFGVVAPDEPFTAVDDSTLIVRLSEPFPPFLGLLGMQYCAVLPREALEKYGDDFRSHPVGTGPFRFHFWIENSRLVLRKNERYFERDESGARLPYLDVVSVSFIPDKSAAYLDLLKGNFDFMSGLHGSYKDEILNAEGELNPLHEDRFYLQKHPFLKTDYLGFAINPPQGNSGPWRNADLRKAVNYGIDRSAMVRYLRNNVYAPADGGFIPRGMPGHTEGSGYSYRPDSVRAILRRAGYPGGKGLEPLRLSTTSDYVDLCEFVQHQLGEFGIEVKVDVLPASVHRERSARGDLEFFRKSWLADYPDDENFMALFYSENITPKGPNYFFYSNARFDSLYNEALGITDADRRRQLYRAMDSTVTADAPVVPLYYDVVMRFVSRRVSGLDSNPMNFLDLRRVKVE